MSAVGASLLVVLIVIVGAAGIAGFVFWVLKIVEVARIPGHQFQAALSRGGRCRSPGALDPFRKGRQGRTRRGRSTGREDPWGSSPMPPPTPRRA